MLDQERIPISKLKQAFDLNGQDVETLISALWPHGVFPYALWEMVYKYSWETVASHNSRFYQTKDFSSFPKYDPLEYQVPLLDIYRGRLDTFFAKLSSIIFVTDLMKGLNRIIELTYEKSDHGFNDDIGYLFDGLSRIESDFNSGLHRPFTFGEEITAEMFDKVFESKALFIAPCTISFLSKMFIDTIVVDKAAAIRHLIDGGYSLRQEVKGISKTIVERITAIPITHPPDTTSTEQPTSVPPATMPAEQPASVSQDNAPTEPPASPIVVPRALWEGKTPQAVRDGMRKEDYADPVIAYVLFNWCKLRNKIRIGKMLGDNTEHQDDSTHRRRANKLLEEAEALTIIPA